MAAAGFRGIAIRTSSYSSELVSRWLPGGGAQDYVASADIEAVKPGDP
jgi:hypothetical protein